MKKLNLLWNPLTVFASSLVFMAVLYFTGCAPTAKQKTVVSAERQQAIKDSLQKIYIYELNKAWSTGYEYYKPKIYRRAIKPFLKVIELDTIDRFKDVYALLSDCYFKLNLPDSAQLVLEMGLAKYSDNVGLRRNLAYILAGKEQIEEAIVEYEKVVEMDDKQINDWKQLANLYIRNNQIDEAVNAYQKIIELDPADQDAQQTLGQLLKSRGEEGAAIEALEKALVLDPENTQLMYDIGRSYFNQGEFPKSIVRLSSYLVRKPDDLVAKELYGEALFNNENYRDALTVFNEITAVNPENKKVYTDIANCHKELKDFQTARNYVYKATKIDNKYGLAYITLGEIYEASVDKCMKDTGKKIPKFDDKLVFKEAVRQYQIATNDLQYRDVAQRKIEYLRDFLPKTEDEFFNKSRKLPDGRYKVIEKCYLWIASSL